MAAIEDSEYKEQKIGCKSTHLLSINYLMRCAVWDDVYGFDYSCIKEIALREPLVDTVDLKAVVTKPYEVRTFDLKTVKKEDLSFTANFALESTRRDCG